MTEPEIGRSERPGAQRVVIDLVTPERWAKRHFFRIGRRRVAGFVIAANPRVFAFGVEIMNEYGKGAALMIGPFWIGLATAPISTKGTEDDR